MKRKLTKEEIALSQKGIEMRKKQLSEVKEQLEYVQANFLLYKAKQRHEDETRAYVRKTEQKSFDDTFAAIKEKMAEHEAVIRDLQSQIKDGVEIKEKEEQNGNR